MDAETSDYINEPSAGNSFLNLTSPMFSNIRSVYSPANGIFRILTADRYGKRFILKCLSEKFIPDPTYNLLLAKEFEIGISLDHPNIRRYIGYEDVPGFGKAIILEYVDGITLDKALNNGCINSDNVIDIATQLIEAVDYIHRKQVLHRDIKPQNVIITHSRSQVKVIDFSLSDSNSFVILKNPAGTRKYLAPEQLAPDAKPTTKADIYSLGKVLGEMADITHNSTLRILSDYYTQENPETRPDSISVNDIKTSGMYEKISLDSPKLTRWLVWIVTILGVIVAVLAYTRFIPH